MAAATAQIARFTRSERGVHWITALAFFGMLATGLLVGRRGAFHDVMYAAHLSFAGILLAGIALIMLGGDGVAVRRSFRDLRRLDADDRRWLATLAERFLEHRPEPPVARFNAGQKVNFCLIAFLLAVLFVSGLETVVVGTHGNLVFGLHKLATIAAAVLVGGHLYMAILNPGTRPALRGMLTGRVDRAWAERHHPLWARSVQRPAEVVAGGRRGEAGDDRHGQVDERAPRLAGLEVEPALNGERRERREAAEEADPERGPRLRRGPRDDDEEAE